MSAPSISSDTVLTLPRPRPRPHPHSLIFGALTTSFTNFASRSAIALSTPGPDTAAALAAAAADLKRVSAQDASYLVYIGEAAHRAVGDRDTSAR